MMFKDKLRLYHREQKPKKSLISSQQQTQTIISQGEIVQNDYGSYLQRIKVFASDEIHGNWSIGQIAKLELPNLLALQNQENQSDFDWSQALFLDTETTGLAGGTGTYAFLIGLGYFKDDQFVLEQYLMRDFDEELAILFAVSQRLLKIKHLITFNGKSFDWPLLKTRFALARLEEAGNKELYHLDLLILARKLWHQKFASLSLNSLERNLLSFIRVGDIPGYEIPQRYFSYVQSKEESLLVDIIEHNVADILSMVSLIGIIDSHCSLAPQQCNCPYIAFALGRLAEKNNQGQKAEAYFKNALTNADCQELAVKILKRITLLCKGQKKWLEMIGFLTKILEIKTQDYWSCIELAKIYEHRLKDLQLAQKYTEIALKTAVKKEQVAWQNKALIKKTLHRLNRIGQKIKLAEERGLS